MKAAEILRSLADMIDQNSDSEQTSSVELTPVEVPNDEHCDSAVMITPLQAKLELLKKSTGVDNVYDTNDTETDDLDQIKKCAGIPTAVQIASDDEPLDM